MPRHRVTIRTALHPYLGQGSKDFHDLIAVVGLIGDRASFLKVLYTTATLRSRKESVGERDGKWPFHYRDLARTLMDCTPTY